ncbi:disease resistance-like protein DSC1 [Cornus florida]|uniref:disease resistance-like protein DSC1 n=1 Tax=Cornus florida TaxID=4283 RepID=UPI00289D79D7|nr:disease resistance-like protein DSC1 [Cornus florida]
MLNLPDDHAPEELHVDVDVFEKMKKLKLLKLSGIRSCGQLTYLSNELCYLNWDDYPAKFLQSNFHPENLVELRLCHNQIKEIPSSIKFLEKLKYLNLSHSLYLYKTPDLSSLPYLEKLNLEGCKNLIEVHESIGVHERLVNLDLRDYLPSSIEILEGLQHLRVGNCRKLKRVPSNIFSRMKDLKILHMGGTAIEQLPSSIVQLYNLTYLYLPDFQKVSPKTPNSLVPFSLVRKRTPPASTNYLQLELLSTLSTLSELNLRNCNLSEESFPMNIGCLPGLQSLDLSESNLSSIPTRLIQLKSLRRLDLENCTSLRTLTSLPSSIEFVNAHGCKSLERYWIPPSGIGPNNREVISSECQKLVMDEMDNMPNISSQTQLQGIQWISFPGSEILQWFRHKSEVEGSSFSFVVDHHRNVKGIAICAVLEFVRIYSTIVFDLKINGYYVRWSEKYSHLYGRCKGNHVILTKVTEYSDELSTQKQPIKNLMKKRPKFSPGPPNICDDDSCYIQASVFSFDYISGRSSSELVTEVVIQEKVKKMGIHLIMEEQGEEILEDICMFVEHHPSIKRQRNDHLDILILIFVYKKLCMSVVITISIVMENVLLANTEILEDSCMFVEQEAKKGSFGYF